MPTLLLGRLDSPLLKPYVGRHMVRLCVCLKVNIRVQKTKEMGDERVGRKKGREASKCFSPGL